MKKDLSFYKVQKKSSYFMKINEKKRKENVSTENMKCRIDRLKCLGH